MKRFIITMVATGFLLAGVTAPAVAQGKGKEKKAEQGQDYGTKAKGSSGKAHADKPQGQDHSKAKGMAKVDKANEKAERAIDKANAKAKDHAGGFGHAVNAKDVKTNLKKFAVSSRVPERIAAGAIARAYYRGNDDDDFVILSANDRVRIKNKKGDVLVDLDDNRARNLGAWDVNVLGNEVKDDAPAFCRSGVGHPVWGRQWCIDKGFGLGASADNLRWGRVGTVSDVIFGNVVTTQPLSTRDLLLGAIGNVVLDRLGLHAVTLGYTQPLTGVWIGEPTGARVLQVNSGGYPVAEFVDANRDNRADVMVVALRPY